MHRAYFYLGLSFCLIAVGHLHAWEARPADTLAEAGLTRLEGTNFWVLRSEQELRARLNEIPEHRRAIAALEQLLSERIDQNFRQWTALNQADKLLENNLAALAGNDPARGEIAKQRTALKAQMIAPDRLGDQAEVRKQLVELTNRRNALWLALANVRHEVPKLADSYAPLSKEAKIAAALGKLGGNHRLGPVKDYGAEVRKLSEFDQAVLTSWVPLYWHGGHLRLSALLNETTPVTFSWSSSPEPIVLTAAMAHAAGIAVPAQAPRKEITLIKGRTYSAAQIKIPTLRLGKHLLRDVETLVLPPQGEDLGARLSVAAFAGFQAQTQPERLRLNIEPTP